MRVITGTIAYGMECECGSVLVVSDRPAPPKFCPNCGKQEGDHRG